MRFADGHSIKRFSFVRSVRTFLLGHLALISLSGCVFEPKLAVKPRALLDRHVAPVHLPEVVETSGSTKLCTVVQAKAALKEAQISRLFHCPEAVRIYRDVVLASVRMLGEHDAVQACPESCVEKHELQSLYNKSLAGLLRSAGFGDGRSAALAASNLQALGVQVASSPGFMEDFEIDELWFSHDYATVMVREPLRESGLGVPMIAYRKPRPRQGQVPESFFPPHWKFAVSAIASISSDDPSGLTITLVDPLENDKVQIGHNLWPLARDLTTPVIHLLSHSGYRDKARQGLFRPQTLTDEEGVTVVHPHRRGRIPFILIHGMGCSPRIMADITNSIHADPELRDKYQVMIVYYTTGDTILQDSMVIRRAFQSMRNYYDPAHTDSAWDQSVVLGHSLGGPIARVLTSFSDHAIENMLFTRPWHTLVMSDFVRQAAEPAIFFEPLHEIKRVIYLAGTMRGSRIADQVEAKALSRVLPKRQQLQQFHDEIALNNGIDVFQAEYRDRVPSSIDNQSPESPLLQVTNQLRQDPWLVSHSIQANATPFLPLPHTTDLLVPYFSSVVENANSQLMLHGQDHFCTHDPRTLAEIKRILHENLQSDTMLTTVKEGD